MLRVIDMLSNQVLSQDDGPVADVLGADFRSPFCVVCEHASSAIPPRLCDLGLSPGDRFSHAVWDIGAEALGRAVARRLGAPFVRARFSRLVHDLNRPPDAPDAIPARTEKIEVPGNRDLTGDERAARADALYHPFHALLAATLDRFETPPALVTIHSFTPVWHDRPRDTCVGFLHDADPALARAMLESYPGPYPARLNEPYSASDGVTHTLARHGTDRGIPNVMIEIRNDLLGNAGAIGDMAGGLSDALIRALQAVRA